MEKKIKYCFVIAFYSLCGCESPAFIPKISPPPPEHSHEAMDDQSLFYHTRSLVGSARWQRARKDAQKGTRHLLDDFSCSVHIRLNSPHTPSLTALVRYVKQGVKRITSYEKEIWKRPRPFMNHDGPICLSPIQRWGLGWSYPSGHAAAGYATALTLGMVFPQDQKALLERGHAFGESRVICGVHWQSDVTAGEQVASDYIQHEQHDPVFQRYLHQAQEEVNTSRSVLTAPDPQRCLAEEEVLRAQEP